MTMHDERYIISIKDGHDGVRIRDQKTGEIHAFTGGKALYDALGVLAEWRERDQARGADAPNVIVDGEGDEWVRRDGGDYHLRGLNGSGWRLERIKDTYGIKETR